MKEKIMPCLLAGALCVLLAACSAKPGPDPRPQPQSQPEQSELQETAPSQPEPQGSAQEPSQQAPEAPAETQEPPALELDPEPETPSQALAPAPEPVPADETPDFAGTWRDSPQGTSGGRCFMEITGPDSDCTIDIYWGSSARETHHWQFFGAYDAASGEIPYSGTHFLDTTLDDGSLQQTVMLKNLTGTLTLDGTGALLWNDDNEQSGEGMIFEREA